MLKRYDGTNWVDVEAVKRYDGSAWVDCQFVRRWDGGQWVDVWVGQKMVFYRTNDLATYTQSYESAIINLITGNSNHGGEGAHAGLVSTFTVHTGDSVQVKFTWDKGTRGSSYRNAEIAVQAGSTQTSLFRVTSNNQDAQEYSYDRTVTVTNDGQLYVKTWSGNDSDINVNMTLSVWEVYVNGVRIPLQET